jgi:hypothetical protein
VTEAKKPQLPIMTPFELTLENEMNVEVQRFNNGWLFKWYGMTYEGGKTDVEDFRGGRIAYAGIKFGHQQQQVFWDAIDRYLDQKVHETFKQWENDTRALSNEVRLKSVDGVERTLGRFVSRIIAYGKETDRRLRGNGYPDSVDAVDDTVANVYTMAEISNLATSHRMLLQYSIESAKPPEPKKVLKWKFLEEFYAENKGLIRLLGALGAGAIAIWGYFFH